MFNVLNLISLNNTIFSTLYIEYNIILYLISQYYFKLPKMNPKIDSLLHQKMMEMHRRDVENIDQELHSQQERQKAELEVRLI